MNTETLRALASKATPGPYICKTVADEQIASAKEGFLDTDEPDHPWNNPAPRFHQIADVYGPDGKSILPSDSQYHSAEIPVALARYIAALDPATVLKLLDVVDAAQRSLETRYTGYLSAALTALQEGPDA